ncbi:MAG: coproporphyrinogen-III oxidase family protein [Streptosporangiaceae bacterium]
MKLLADTPDKFDLAQLIKDRVQGDYIYMYPPRQAYRAMDPADLAGPMHKSLAGTSGQPLNLYLHFPFCKQICGFCNLYSVATSPGADYSDYVGLLAQEMQRWAPLTAGRKVDTIYLGGGTPSILPTGQLDRCLTSLEAAFGVTRASVPEVAIEVAPDTVDEVKLREMRDIGITRVNLGLQTTSDDGLHQIGRRHGFSLARKRIEDALSCGFDNVCVDLIYGLPDQDLPAWQAIVRDVLAFQAPTVCAYPLTLRPNTGFSRRNLELVGTEQYLKYDVAREMLGEAGYAQETHVRYITPEVGGYRQKANHWAGQDVLGMGAGGRGYLHECDYRNGYSIKRRRSALEAYAASMSQDRPAYNAGFVLTTDERMRRQVILGLLNLDRARFRAEFGIDVADRFEREMAQLDDLGLARIGDTVQLTESGRKYRDLIAQMFFSTDVWNRIREFDYTE